MTKAIARASHGPSLRLADEACVRPGGARGLRRGKGRAGAARDPCHAPTIPSLLAPRGQAMPPCIASAPLPPPPLVPTDKSGALLQRRDTTQRRRCRSTQLTSGQASRSPRWPPRAVAGCHRRQPRCLRTGSRPSCMTQTPASEIEPVDVEVERLALGRRRARCLEARDCPPGRDGFEPASKA